jgi:predicted metal-dependent enzyme (double-stranded beta helix superfamily)
MTDTAIARQEACEGFMRQARTIIDAEGATDAALQKVKALLVDLAARSESLFPPGDFAMPEAQGRNHPLVVEDNDGFGLYLTIALPGKETAPHDHAIWCVNAGISGRELHRFYRRTDDGSREGYATVEEIGQSLIAPGLGMTMTDHAIHGNEVVGTEPAWALALYGYALARFPAVAFFHPAFSSTRTMPSRRPMAVV